MMGCLDETRTLKYGQVFVQASSSANEHKFVVTGQVVVAKNPCLHPGDVRVLKAVDVPALRHMFDYVFPQQGPRQEIKEYFTNYIVNESLGIIANAHVVFADKEYMKAESAPCIELAKLFSVAVDFPKTGVPALIPHELHVKEYPDFMEKLDKPTYISKGVLGKL
ncbi:hypothetical protein PR202_ga19917 [Eleusine coracana subsp. coracana]|uniref:RNA-dependent RNA polymerase n=1 Tax=Eleusine coracana subsp. coracana TaxID=191504 RepID=A0AAV5CWD8_ELECO|nr:hypothetical protein PR202_ga19917 [Eleusine coracana subsp. coracana]